MKELLHSRVYRFHPERLDPVTIYVEQYTGNASRITVQCYARAWTAYWGNHGGNSVEQFVSDCNADYVAENLAWGWNGLLNKRIEKAEYAYLLRIVQAIQNHWSSLFKEKS